MDLEAWSSAISNLAQAAAILIGGGWAYMKFVRGRTFRYRARLETDAELFEFRDQPVMRVRVNMQNEGLSRIDISLQDENQVMVYAAARDRWIPDLSVDWNEREPIRRATLFDRHAWIEPNETIDDDLLIPLGGPGERPVAYRVRAVVKAPRITVRTSVRSLFPHRAGKRRAQVWTDDLVVPIALDSGRNPARKSQPGPTTAQAT